MSHSNAALDSKLRDLLKVMVSRLPTDKRLSAPVVQQWLRAKYSKVYPEAYISAQRGFIDDTITSLLAERDAAASGATVNAAEGIGKGDADGDEEEESSGSDSDASDDEDGSEEDEEEESGSDEEEDESDFDSDNDEGSDDTPERKKVRQEEEEESEEAALLAKAGATATATAGNAADTAERCKGMVACLKRLSYRVRAPNESESLEEYLNNYLVGEFAKHGMDPLRYGKADIKQYKVRREVELLQQDGASLNLDRRNRIGRGFAGVALPGDKAGSGDGNGAGPSAPSAYKTSAFLDDE